MGDIQHLIMTAVGGMNITTTVEGRERYPVRIRYHRELRDSLEDLERVLVPTPGGAQVPLGQVASIRKVEGHAKISGENTLPYVRLAVRPSTSPRTQSPSIMKARPTTSAVLAARKNSRKIRKNTPR